MKKRFCLFICMLFLLSAWIPSEQVLQIALARTLTAAGAAPVESAEEATQAPPPEDTAIPAAPTSTSQPTETEIPATSTPIVFVPTQPQPDPNNLVQNGYFLDEFDEWKRELVDEGGSSKSSLIEFGSSDFNRALQLQHDGLGMVTFDQTIPVPSTNLEFSASFYSRSTEGLIFGFSGTGYAMILLIYQDADGNDLGATRVINFNENLFAGSPAVGAPEKMKDTNTLHNIQVNSEETYEDFRINIQEELNFNLLGVDASAVSQIMIKLVAGSNDKDASAELIVSDLVLKEIE